MVVVCGASVRVEDIYLFVGRRSPDHTVWSIKGFQQYLAASLVVDEKPVPPFSGAALNALKHSYEEKIRFEND